VSGFGGVADRWVICFLGFVESFHGQSVEEVVNQVFVSLQRLAVSF
jgi:hypothetical protein